jgi:molybdenum-dependent DNA-binding transcriptional regulator ModE
LRAFNLVAETGSATRAAAALHRAQSAVTRSVQELESALGERLFERKLSGMLITATGSAVLQRCRRILSELEELAQWSAAQQTRRRVASEGALRAYLLNTRRLQIFVSLARHRHMPTAAKAFGISQPAVSSAIRVLESGSGLLLFHIAARGQSTPQSMDAGFQHALAHAAEGHAPGLHVRMPSGAGHDAQILAERMKSAMLFVPSIGGISHHYAENTDDADIVLGCQVMADAAAEILAR